MLFQNRRLLISRRPSYDDFRSHCTQFYWRKMRPNGKGRKREKTKETKSKERCGQRSPIVKSKVNDLLTHSMSGYLLSPGSVNTQSIGQERFVRQDKYGKHKGPLSFIDTVVGNTQYFPIVIPVFYLVNLFLIESDVLRKLSRKLEFPV